MIALNLTGTVPGILSGALAFGLDGGAGLFGLSVGFISVSKYREKIPIRKFEAIINKNRIIKPQMASP